MVNEAGLKMMKTEMEALTWPSHLPQVAQAFFFAVLASECATAIVARHFGISIWEKVKLHDTYV